MIIRSQKRDVLVPVDRFVITACANGTVCYSHDGYTGLNILGKYNSKERAVEIINKIQHFYYVASPKFVFDMPEE